MRIQPKKRGEGFEFVSEIRGASIPQNFIPSIEKGVKEVVFDRGSFLYHGRVKAFADGLREGGLKI